jgi:hypothetical protein
MVTIRPTMTTLPTRYPAAEALAPGASDRVPGVASAMEALADGGDGALGVPVVQAVTIDSAVTVAATAARKRVRMTRGTIT